MSRYLTSSKIALLVLASIYTEGVIPNSETSSFLSFLVGHILQDNTNPLSVSVADSDHTVPVSAIESDLSGQVSGIPGRTVWDLFLKQLWSIDCSDSLDQFITNLPFLLTRSPEQIKLDQENEEIPTDLGRISRTSPLGAFIRRSCLEYTRLQFQDAITLWQDLISYRAPTRQAWERRNPADGRSALDVNLSDLHIDASHPLSQLMYGRLIDEEEPRSGYSTYDVEKLMEFQVAELQRLGGRITDDMRRKIGQMSKAGIAVPKLAHYLKFLDSWRAGDYSSAFESLHRYFDYTMQSRDRTFYQYALLNLAILQADFGCYKEAISAMQESIATARENKDTTCLNFCMSWLYHFGKAFPAEMQELRNSGILGSETESLAFLKSRAKDTEMWSLLSTSLLNEAKLGLQHGDSLAQVLENIVKAKHINIVKSVGSVVGPALLMQGSIYARVGLAHLAWSAGETFLECYASDAPAEDIMKCSCRMAGLLAQGGRYDEATKMVENVEKDILRVLKYQQYSIFFSGTLKLRRHLHRNDIEAARNVLTRLQGQGAPDIELRYSLVFLEIDLLIRRGKFNEAVDLVESLAEKAQMENPDVMVQVKLLTVKARLLAISGHPLKGFTLIVRAASMASRARVLPALWAATGVLSNILIELEEFTAAVTLLEAIVPQVLECNDNDLAATTLSYLVDAHMGLAGEADSKSNRRKEETSKAMEYIDCAFQHFRHMEDLRGQTEMLAKKATILHWRGDLVLANDTASQYLELKKEYAVAHI